MQESKRIRDLSEEDYIALQISKTSQKKLRSKLLSKFDKKVKIFKRRFDFPLQQRFIKKGGRALCLGARMGEEVQALREMEMDAIGVDLVPYPPLVIEGNFQKLQWEDNTFDLVYSNAVDHVSDLEEFFREAYRVTKQNGVMIFDFFPDEKNAGATEMYVLDVPDLIYTLCNKMDIKVGLLSVHAKLAPLYRKSHKETQCTFRKLS